VRHRLLRIAAQALRVPAAIHLRVIALRVTQAAIRRAVIPHRAVRGRAVIQAVHIVVHHTAVRVLQGHRATHRAVIAHQAVLEAAVIQVRLIHHRAIVAAAVLIRAIRVHRTAQARIAAVHTAVLQARMNLRLFRVFLLQDRPVMTLTLYLMMLQGRGLRTKSCLPEMVHDTEASLFV
jgi:hypothetical protein